MSALGLAGGTAGTAVAGPVGGVAGSFLGNTISNLFGGPARDASRQANVDWYKNAALAGSVIAARVIIAAPANTASNEDPMWIAAAAQVQSQRPDVLAKANQAGGLWVNGTIQMVQQELQTLAATSATGSPASPATPGGVTSIVPIPPATAQRLPAMVTTATNMPSKLSPLVLAGIAFGVVLVFFIALRGRRHG